MSPYYPATDGRPYGFVWRAEGVCHIPGCLRAQLGVGPYGFLCLEDALTASGAPPRPHDGPTAPVDDGSIRRAFRASLRVPAAPCEPGPGRASTVEPPDPALVAAALLAMRGLGAVPLRTEPTYGDVEGLPAVQVIPARAYAHAPSRAITVTPDDERVPRTARTLARQAVDGGWSVRLRAVDDPPSLVLRTWRGPSLLVARWEVGKFVQGWAMHGRGMPIALGARQLGVILKADGVRAA